jgi:hypothetical protein
MRETSNERIERLLVLLLLHSMKGTSQGEKVTQLNIAGFSNFEIAEFLNTTPAVVASLLYQSKKSRKPKRRKS